ncbi:MAG: ATP-binding cassette domain-containing protein [Deltaproteobacteria bacterium]|nr:ATP-binding cassette domain-containing protein [Deltaproteobacteria bacterium]
MIRLERVSKQFGHASVLDGVSLEVPKGCLYGLIGPGASGKSVLLKLTAGLLVPSDGRVVIDGTNLATLSELELQRFRMRFGMLFQNNALFDYLTVGENIAFPLRRLTDWSEERIEERVADRLRAVSLPGFGDRLCAGLSGGQKKRVGVARATVISGAEIVLYDEPAAGLDPVTSQRIFELLREEQRASGATVIMVSSDLDRMLSVTDRVGMLNRGALVFDGTTEEARSSTEPVVRQFVHGLVDGPL